MSDPDEHPSEFVDAPGGTLDLDAVEDDLREVESALARLADGTYFASGTRPDRLRD